MADEIKRPFDPDGGEFAENIRNITGDDDALRESMKVRGWLKELPAFKDENGVVIVGHRRLRIAKELGIKPVVQELTFGKGDTGDAKRLQLAIASNTGGKGLTQGDRKRIAKYLYVQQSWKMQEIADALNVSQKTISLDLDGVYTSGINSERQSKRGRVNEGRPKGSTKKSQEVEEKHNKVRELAGQGMSPSQIAPQVDLTPRMVDRVLEVKRAEEKGEEKGRREALADPPIDPSTLSMSAQQKFDAAVRQHKARLDANFRFAVDQEVIKRIDEIVLPHWKEKIAEAQTLYEKRRALMDKDTFNTIRRALHPDSRQSISDKKLGEAFDTFMGLEKYLLNEKDSPTDLSGLPNSWAEWEEARRRTTADRKRRRAGQNPLRRQ